MSEDTKTPETPDGSNSQDDNIEVLRNSTEVIQLRNGGNAHEFRTEISRLGPKKIRVKLYCPNIDQASAETDLVPGSSRLLTFRTGIYSARCDVSWEEGDNFIRKRGNYVLENLAECEFLGGVTQLFP